MSLDDFNSMFKMFDCFEHGSQSQFDFCVDMLSNKLNIESRRLDLTFDSLNTIDEKILSIQQNCCYIDVSFFAPLSFYAAYFVKKKKGGEIKMISTGRKKGPCVTTASEIINCWFDIYANLFCNNDERSYYMIVEKMAAD